MSSRVETAPLTVDVTACYPNASNPQEDPWERECLQAKEKGEHCGACGGAGMTRVGPGPEDWEPCADDCCRDGFAYCKPSTTTLFISHDKPHALKGFFSYAGTSPAKPMPSRVASLEAPGAPKAKKTKSFFLLDAPVEVWWDATTGKFEICDNGITFDFKDITSERAERFIADLQLVGGGFIDRKHLVEAGKLEAFKKALDGVQMVESYLESMMAPELIDTNPPPSPSYEPTTPPPAAWAEYYKAELDKERAKTASMVSTMDALASKNAALERVVSWWHPSEPPVKGRKRPASAMW